MLTFIRIWQTVMIQSGNFYLLIGVHLSSLQLLHHFNLIHYSGVWFCFMQSVFCFSLPSFLFRLPLFFWACVNQIFLVSHFIFSTDFLFVPSLVLWGVCPVSFPFLLVVCWWSLVFLGLLKHHCDFYLHLQMAFSRVPVSVQISPFIQIPWWLRW